MKLPYLTSCVALSQSEVPALREMIDSARSVTLKTFRKRVESRRWEEAMGYESRGGLPLSRDWHVAFYKSKWKGRACYYAVHSAIEHIFSNQ